MADAARPARRGTARQRLILVLLAVCLALLLAEGLLRLLLPINTKRMRYMGTRSVFQYEEGAIQFDPELGYITTPDRNVAFVNDELKVNVATNSAGFRDDEASLADPDVLYLGD